MTTTVTQLGHLSPLAQIQQFCSSWSSALNRACKSTDSTFRRVYVMKRDEQGNIRSHNVKDKVTGEPKTVYVLSYIEDIETGNMQLDEPAYIISAKCALLILGIPFYTIGRMGWHLFKTPVEISALMINTLKKANKKCAIERFYEAAVEMRCSLSQIPGMLGDGLLEIVKDVLFGVGAELASIYGVIRPYQGRWFEQISEHHWQNGAHYKDDFRYVPSRAGENCCEAFIKDVKDSHPCYLAHCFQIRNNVHNPHVMVIRREAL